MFDFNGQGVSPAPKYFKVNYSFTHAKAARANFCAGGTYLLYFAVYQYIPPMSGLGAAGAGGVGISVTMLSVVSSVAATEAAF